MQIKHLNKTYDRHTKNANPVLKDISFTLPETGFVCILGPSGCGKTSLLNAIGGLDRFDSGEISIHETTVKSYGTKLFEAERNRSFGYIFQNYYLLQEHTVAYNVYLGLHSLQLSHAEKLRRVKEALRAVDMERYLLRKTGALSGGQQQRVAIARALARRPRVIFADEPTGNLDEANTLNICSLLRRISKTSLVVMVTHEERIANFFADRIIRLDGGVISANDGDWQRGDLTVEGANTIYAGDLKEETLEQDGLRLRFLREEGAQPVNISIVALKDRIVIKLDDGRSISCTPTGENPKLQEGNLPAMTLEHLDQEELPEFSPDQTLPARAGHGLRFSMMLSEALQLLKGKGARQFGAWFFMVVLTVLTLLTVGDFLTVASVDPHDFVLTHSHILEIQVERGKGFDVANSTINTTTQKYLDHILSLGSDMMLLPYVNTYPQLSESVFLQLEAQTLKFEEFSYVPNQFLDESTLILGRMPENINEVVIDRWVLDAVLSQDGILQNSISDVSFFLGKELNYPKLNCTTTIVGIADGNEAAMYISKTLFASLGTNSASMITLSDLQQLYPGTYDNVTLAEGECLAIFPNVPSSVKVGSRLTLTKNRAYVAQDVIIAPLSHAKVVLADDQLTPILQEMVTQRFYLYCPDKEAVKQLLAQPLPEALQNKLQIDVIDRYADSWTECEEASRIRADARTIVTVTVMALSAVMLYLLRRSQVHSRIELLAVYRLLGIPKGKLTVIFLLVSLLTFCISALPAAVLTYGTVTVLTGIEDIPVAMVLPWQVVAAVSGVILVYHILVSLIPLRRLLSLPPARLAAKYDF